MPASDQSPPVLLGSDFATGRSVDLPYKARKLGTYVIGTPGKGKSSMLLNLVMQDINSGHGLCAIDPQGEWIENILSRIPAEREQDVIYFSPAEKDRPLGLHLFDCVDPDDDDLVDLVTSSITRGIFQELWGDLFKMPQLGDVLRAACKTLIRAQSLPDKEMRPSIIELPLLFENSDYRRYMVGHLERNYAASERGLINWWKDFYEPKSNRDRQILVSSTLNKIREFDQTSMINRVVGQNQTTLDFRYAMDTGKIVLVDLAGGQAGEEVATLLGSLIVSRIYLAAKSRVDLLKAGENPRRFHLLVDEFQNFASYAFSKLQDECRQYAIDITIAHQNRHGQLTGEHEVQASTLGMSNWIVFQAIGNDATALATGFETSPPDPDERSESQNFQFVSFPWDSLQHGSNGNQQIANLVYEIEEYLVVEGHWDYGELIRERYHIAPDAYLDASVWGFPKERHKVSWGRQLNQVLYLMMTDEYEANGEATEAKLLALVEALFSQRYVETNVSAGWESATAVPKYISNAVEYPDPPMGWDWGESAERQLEEEMEYHRGGARGMSDTAQAWARLQMRRQVLTKIAQLGGLLKEQPLKERGGQPEIEYMNPRTHKEIADEKANQITQLPPHQALVRIQGVEGMVENHLRTIHAEMEWPKGSDNPTKRIRENTRQQYGVPLDQVREGLRRRARPYDNAPDTQASTIENGNDEVEEEFPAFGLIDA